MKKQALPRRCNWAQTEPMIAYHDGEWGVPVHDDRKLFEMLCLEGAQAGLSWEIVLRRRERYRELFRNFDPALVARMTPARIEKILQDPGIIRNRSKIVSVVANAKALLKIRREFGSFDAYIWRFVDGKPIVNRRRSAEDVPASTKQSEEMSRDLKKRGFSFVGPTICYAFMQAVGMVNDHRVSCDWHVRRV
jgi:DNA-3-methyladenine glycosylase I